MYTLRDYQQKGIDLIREKLGLGQNKIMFWSMTGSGKGLVMSELANLNISKNRKTLAVMRRKDLIVQTQNNFKKYHGIESSIIMGTHKGFDENQSVQIASIDTLSRRYKNGSMNFLLSFDTILVDEAHDTTSDIYRGLLLWLDAIGNKKIFIGLTATPFRVGNKCHDWWDSCVKPIEADELRDRGFLVPDKIYAPKKIDTSMFRVSAGEFNQRDVFDEVSKLSVVGDVVDCYIKYGQNKPAVLFAVNIVHSKMLAEAFSATGIPAEHHDQSSSQGEREHGINGLKSGRIKILCNVNIFSTGVDIPNAEVGIMARPTMSEILDIQQRGRLLRPYKVCSCGKEFGAEDVCHEIKYEKKFAILLDHGNNTERHGLTYEVREAVMDINGVKTSKLKKGEVEVKQCQECFIYVDPDETECPSCGFVFKVKSREFNVDNGELTLIDQKAYEKKIKDRIIKSYGSHIRQSRYKYSPRNHAFKAIYKEFGIKCFEYIKFPEMLEKELRRKTVLTNFRKGIH